MYVPLKYGALVNHREFVRWFNDILRLWDAEVVNMRCPGWMLDKWDRITPAE